MHGDQSFPETLRARLAALGFHYVGENIYELKKTHSSVWMLVMGNRFFCTVDVGVVIHDLNEQLGLLISRGGINKLIQGLDYRHLPLVYAPLEEYTQLPHWMVTQTGDNLLGEKEAAELVSTIRDRVVPSLEAYCSLADAAAEARRTINYVLAKPYLLPLAYYELGRKSDAERVVEHFIRAFKAQGSANLYEIFIAALLKKYIT